MTTVRGPIENPFRPLVPFILRAGYQKVERRRVSEKAGRGCDQNERERNDEDRPSKSACNGVF